MFHIRSVLFASIAMLGATLMVTSSAEAQYPSAYGGYGYGAYNGGVQFNAGIDPYGTGIRARAGYQPYGYQWGSNYNNATPYNTYGYGNRYYSSNWYNWGW